jgi:hypothetical protein
VTVIVYIITLKSKKAKKKILLENCQTKIAETLSILSNLSELTTRKVKIQAIKWRKLDHRLQTRGIKYELVKVKNADTWFNYRQQRRF